MRRRTQSYFFGILFSRLSIYAYGIAGTITTGLQLLLLWFGYFSDVPRRAENLPVFIDLFIETMLPVWIGTITPWNVLMVVLNLFLALFILLIWTDRYDRSY